MNLFKSRQSNGRFLRISLISVLLLFAAAAFLSIGSRAKAMPSGSSAKSDSDDQGILSDQTC